jgi:hypothetical protein
VGIFPDSFLYTVRTYPLSRHVLLGEGNLRRLAAVKLSVMTYTHDRLSERRLLPKASTGSVIVSLRVFQLCLALVAIGAGLHALVLIAGEASNDRVTAHDEVEPLQCATIRYSHRRLICYDYYFMRPPFQPAKDVKAAPSAS